MSWETYLSFIYDHFFGFHPNIEPMLNKQCNVTLILIFADLRLSQNSKKIYTGRLTNLLHLSYETDFTRSRTDSLYRLGIHCIISFVTKLICCPLFAQAMGVFTVFTYFEKFQADTLLVMIVAPTYMLFSSNARFVLTLSCY